MKNKKFDCIAMKRAAASRIYEQTKDMNLEQRIVWWQEKHRDLLKRQKERTSRRSKGNGESTSS